MKRPDDIKEYLLTEPYPFTVVDQEAKDLMKFYMFAENVAGLFPSNEDEEIRLYKFAKVIWRCSELYHTDKDGL